MKSMTKIRKHYDRILKRAEEGKPEPISTDENYQHARADLLMSGMIVAVQLNPRMIFKKLV